MLLIILLAGGSLGLGGVLLIQSLNAPRLDSTRGLGESERWSGDHVLYETWGPEGPAKWDEAEKHYQASIKAASSVEAYAGLGDIYKRRGDFAKSSGYLEKALALEPRNARALWFYGRLLWEHKKHDLAELRFKEILEIDPRHSETLWDYGSMLGELGRYSEGAVMMERFAKVNPKNLEAVRWAEEYRKLGSKKK